MTRIPFFRRPAALVTAGAAALFLTATMASRSGGHDAWSPRGASSGQSGRFWHHGDRGRHLCGGGQHLETMIGAADAFLGLTPTQREAWDRLAGALRTGQASLETACRDQEPDGAALAAPETLGRLESLLTAGLAALRDIRPAFAGFYATLSDTQRAALDRLVSHRH